MYSRRVFSPIILAASLLAVSAPLQAQMVVSVPYTNVGFVSSYDATTGSRIAGKQFNGEALTSGVVYGPDGKLYVAQYWPGGNLWDIYSMHWDGVGALSDVSFFDAGGQVVGGQIAMDGPVDMEWAVIDGQDKLFVTSYETGAVVKYNSDGTIEDLFFGFVSSGGDFFPWGLEVDHRNDIYVVNRNNLVSNIYKFDGDTADLLDDPNDGDGVFAKLTAMSPGGDGWWPLGIAIGPDGDIYVSATPDCTEPGCAYLLNGGGALFRIRPDSTDRLTDGSIIGVYIDPTGAVLNFPQDLEFGDDGMLYVANSNGQNSVNSGADVQRFTPDLQHLGVFIPPNTDDPRMSHIVFVPTVCRDLADNDGDGLVDLSDPGCRHAHDPSEHDGIWPCDDGIDNDDNGLSDFPEDPGCDSRDDLTEFTAPIVCSDGIDNDGDGMTDFPADIGCRDGTANSKENPECQDGIDNDDDGHIDAADPQCAAAPPWYDHEEFIRGRCTTGGPAAVLPFGELSLLLLLPLVALYRRPRHLGRR